MIQCHGAWMLHCCHNAVTAIKQSPLLIVCCSSLAVVTTIVILLMDVLLVMLFGRVNVWKVFFFTSGQCSSIALKAGSVCVIQQQCAVVNLKFTRSKLCSTCNTFEQCYWLKIWGRFTMWWFHTRFCDTINVFDTSIYCASEISLTVPKKWGDLWNLSDSGSRAFWHTGWSVC